MKIIFKQEFPQKLVLIFMGFLLVFFPLSAGCIHVPLITDESLAITNVYLDKEKPSTSVSPTPVQILIDDEIIGQSFTPDMPPELMEILKREGKVPSSEKSVENAIKSSIAIPTLMPTSYVTRQDDSYPEEYFLPSRSSIYFMNESSNPESLPFFPVYSESGILLNSTIKNFVIHVQKGPFLINFSVHPMGSPLVSWARISILDSYQNVIDEDGFNREFSSEKEKEFVVYRNGTFLLQMTGEAATLDICIKTPDGLKGSGIYEKNIIEDKTSNLPRDLHEILEREGKI